MVRKTFRDLRKNWISFLSVFLMSFICLFIFTGIFHLSQQMDATGKEFVRDSRLADNVLSVASFNAEKEQEMNKLENVKQVARRSIGRYQTDQFSLTVLTFNHSDISRPQVIRGAKLTDRAGIWLDEDFFQARHYQLGETFLIENTSYEILGTVRQPEFIYHTASEDQPLPNHKKSGYAYLSQQSFEHLRLYPVHQLLVKTKKNSNTPWLEKELADIWAADYLELNQPKDTSGLSIFFDRVTQIQRLAFLFSSLFLLLTLITMEATMRRFVKQQQLQIAVLKAQGFSRRTVLLHYLSFGMIVTLFGASLGCLLGPKLLSPALLTAIGNQFSVPAWLEVHTSLGYLIVALVTLLNMLITLLPILPLIGQLPAKIMQKQSNQRFKRVWLEHTKLWSHLPFALQWTLRDIQRNRRRAVLGIFGALGCMLLLIAALGIKDSINFSLDSIFNDTYRYEEKVTFKKPLNAQERTAAAETITDYQWLEQQNIKLLKDSEEQAAKATIVSDGNELAVPTLDLQDLAANQVGLSGALAKKLKVKPKDTVYIKLQQQIFPVYIKTIVPSSPQGLFFSQAVWENLQQTFEPQSLLLPKKDQLSEMPLIASRNDKQQQFEDSQKLLEGILMIVTLLILAALALGITIMLNCHLLIVSERFIEFATLKVLGFTKREVLSLSFLETSLLTLIGWLLGLPAGWLFLKAYVAMVSTDQQQYLPHITFQSLALASLVLFGCMLLVQAYLNLRINRIDFATALKPAE